MDPWGSAIVEETCKISATFEDNFKVSTSFEKLPDSAQYLAVLGNSLLLKLNVFFQEPVY